MKHEQSFAGAPSPGSRRQSVEPLEPRIESEHRTSLGHRRAYADAGLEISNEANGALETLYGCRRSGRGGRKESGKRTGSSNYLI